MKVLLLSCSTGGGHDAAAKALIEEFNERNIEAIRIDSIELTSKKFSRKVDNQMKEADLKMNDGNNKVITLIDSEGNTIEFTKIDENFEK